MEAAIFKVAGEELSTCSLLDRIQSILQRHCAGPQAVSANTAGFRCMLHAAGLGGTVTTNSKGIQLLFATVVHKT
jgi:hypothetical protein